ncbi:hypothetical protein CTI12_AA246610 [Artemisia annua]|uniref:Reverse transcriptase zinc-binding domain-containing protein n=1 Tax=Artemisia annua TaxID=35608 RepID=A0A2U1NMX4_ARTAN|nr:hypothetical protein CTI12_AA246610 [Artemisia annua]
MEDSLPARILKTRYYPRGSFLDARIGYRPSFVWRSLCTARDIIRKGKRWNIGNGMKVRIWEDYWLEGFRTLDYRPENSDYRVVNDLLEGDTNAWNHTLLLQLFLQQIARKIACTHINTFEHDSLYWDASSNGVFTCKSAYWIATQTIEGFQDSVLTHERRSLKCIWLANIPGKVKIFAWKACMNLLPTVSNLMTKGLAPGSLSCVHCTAPMEDIKHALFLCNWARDVWASMNLMDLTDQAEEIPIEEIITTAKDRGNETLNMMLMGMWRIWCARNSKAHGGKHVEPNEIKLSTSGILDDFTRANVNWEENRVTSNNPCQVRWSPPTNGVIKINADGGISSENGVAGLGFIMRCHNGSVLVAGNKHVAYATSVIEVEVKAIL